MKSISQINQSLSIAHFKRIRVILVLIFIFFLLFCVYKVESQKNEILEYTKNVFSHNVNTPKEESNVLFLIKNFNSNFEVRLDRYGILCGPLNCYSISFNKLYLKYSLIVFVYLLLMVLLEVLLRSNIKDKEEKISEYLDSLTYILESNNEIELKGNLPLELIKVLKLIKLREDSQQFTQSAKAVAHDVQSPLAVLEMISRDISFNDIDTKDLFDGAITRLNLIINDLLEINESASFEKIDLNILLQKVISYKQLESSNIILEYSYNGAEGIYSEVSLIRLERVISNLINNAIEASDGISNSIKVRLTSEGENNIITIIDYGEGFPEAILNHSPELYSSIGKEHGTGIGLFTAKRVIDELGGCLEISNQQNRSGGVVRIKLPKA